MFNAFKTSPRRLLAALGLFALSAQAGAPVRADPPGGTAGWASTFDDEFNGTAPGSQPDPSVWIPQTTYDNLAPNDPNGVGVLMAQANFNPRGHQPAYYVPSAVTEDGQGHLDLTDTYVPVAYTAPYGQYGPVHYAAAWLTSGHFEQTYGYFEASMKPTMTPGVDSAFWLLRKGVWPPEFDVAEFMGGNRINIYGQTSTGQGYAVNQGFHGAVDSGGFLSTVAPPAAPFTAAFHTYGLDWEPTFITFYLDGKVTKTLTNKDLKDIPSQAMYLNLTNEMEVDSGDWFGDPAQGKYPATTQVDWVRVWQHKARQRPFNGPHVLPGTVRAADYDAGGQTLAYNSAQNAGSYSIYRPHDLVGIRSAGDDGSLGVGWTSPGQYLKYTVKASAAGTYAISFRVAAPGGGSLHLLNSDGVRLTGPISVPATGGDETWAMTKPVPVTLKAGVQTLELYEDTGGYSLRSLTFTRIK